MAQKQIKIGVVTFSHAPEYASTSEREEYVHSEYDKLCTFLSENGFEVVAPLHEYRSGANYTRYGISDVRDLEYCIDYLKNGKVDCLIIQLSQWIRVALAVTLLKEMDLPSALYADTDDRWAGEVTASAVAASTFESAYSKNLILLERFRDSEKDDVLFWLKGTGTLQSMKKGRIIAWGGTYGADIPWTRDDEAILENTFIKEILHEQEIVLIEAARKIVKDDPKRIDTFIKWLTDNNVQIRFDNQMLTEDALKFQIGQYFAAKDRLKELQDENVIGVSIKCHFEVSTNCIGCTECLIPGFLPFGEDCEGEKEIVPVACEGDLKGLLSLVMLHMIEPEIPPLFGDMIYFKKSNLLMSNCGASSVYWAGRSNDINVSLPRVSLLPQVHGKSGSTVHYITPGGDVTLARLFRVKGQYLMYLGVGRVSDDPSEVKMREGAPWPQTYVVFDSDPYLLYRTSPCNHGCVTEGDVTKEVEAFCRHAGVRVIRCDDNSSLEDYLKDLPYF